MDVELNGRVTELPEVATVADAVAATGTAPDGRGIAVAVDGEVVPRTDWPSVRLADGQSVEVVRAVQGG
jgi:sulfur carrier protein